MKREIIVKHPDIKAVGFRLFQGSEKLCLILLIQDQNPYLFLQKSEAPILSLYYPATRRKSETIATGLAGSITQMAAIFVITAPGLLLLRNQKI
jgi:hypothetical protein